jgi:hypothetical protein
MLKISNTKKSPPGNYRMTVPQTGVHLSHYDWDSFVKLYTDHLRANNIHLGVGWEDEMQNELCRQNPQWNGVCEESNPSKERVISNGDIRNFLTSVARIIENEVRGKDAFVPQEEAERRAAICAGCPNNEPTVNWCSTCPGNVIWAIGKFREAFKKPAPNMTSSLDDKLFSCKICGCANAVQIHISTECLTRVKDYEYPEHCWKK